MNEAIADQAQKLRELVDARNEVRVISVTSGKGGVGKSSLSVNLAIALSRLGVRALVIDGDFGLANVDIMLGVTSRYNVSHFLQGERTFNEIIQFGHEGVRFISGGSGMSDLLKMGEDQLERLMDGITSLDLPIDVIIIDTGAGINDKIVHMILSSTETIVVTTTEPTAILDAFALVKTVTQLDKSHHIHVLINKCANPEEAQRVMDGFVEFIGRHLGKSVNPLGLVTFNQDVPLSIKRQVPIMVSAPGGQTSKEIDKIARAILDMPIETSPNNIFSRILGRLRGS